jgi:hypothetical protein
LTQNFTPGKIPVDSIVLCFYSYVSIAWLL